MAGVAGDLIPGSPLPAQKVEQAVLVDRHRKGLADALVVEGRLAGIHGQVVHLEGGRPVDLDGIDSGERLHTLARQRGAEDAVDLTRLQCQTRSSPRRE